MVTVVIPTHNRAGRVHAAVDSALAQTYKNTEVVVVDDCSADGTADLLEERYGGRITVIRRGLNGGAVRRAASRPSPPRLDWLDPALLPAAGLGRVVKALPPATQPCRCICTLPVMSQCGGL